MPKTSLAKLQTVKINTPRWFSRREGFKNTTKLRKQAAQKGYQGQLGHRKGQGGGYTRWGEGSTSSLYPPDAGGDPCEVKEFEEIQRFRRSQKCFKETKCFQKANKLLGS